MAALATHLLPMNLEAQSSATGRRIYVISPRFSSESDERHAFKAALRELGYVPSRLFAGTAPITFASDAIAEFAGITSVCLCVRRQKPC